MKYKYDHRSFSLALFVVCVRLVKYVTVVASAGRQAGLGGRDDDDDDDVTIMKSVVR